MTPKERLEKQLKYCGIDKYHSNGFKGKGITILNHEYGGDHANMTSGILREVAPEVTIIGANVGASFRSGKLMYYNFTIDGVKYTPEEMYEKFKPDIMSVSFSGDNNRHLLEEKLIPLQEKGLVIVNSAGNVGSNGVTSKYKNIDLTIGAVGFLNDGDIPSLMNYSSYDKDNLEVDFVGFLGSSGSGTSASCPFVAGQIALIMQKYGKMKQQELKQFLIKCARDVGDKGVDNKYGYGVIIMPEGDVEMIKFTDTNGHWAEKDISKAVESGILKGYLDGTFKPNNAITRAEMSVIINRILERCYE